MKKIILGLILLSSIFYGVEAAQITAIDCTSGSVQAAIDSAKDGDIVIVPPGNAEWSSTVVIPAELNIHLMGSGKEATIIKHASNFKEPIIRINTELGKTASIQGFTIDASDNDKMLSYGSIFVTGTSRKVLIFDNNFEMGGGGGRFISTLGYNYGVIFNNTFHKSWGSQQAIGIKGDGDSAFDRPLTFGTDNAWYVENNVVTYDVAGESFIDAYTGARFVSRFNIINGPTEVGTHGLDSGERTTLMVEVYNNKFSSELYRAHAFGSRGGTGVVWGNTVSGTGYEGFAGLRSYRSCPNAESSDAGATAISIDEVAGTLTLTDTEFEFNTIANLPEGGNNSVNDLYNIDKNDHCLILSHGEHTVTCSLPTTYEKTWEVGDRWAITNYFNQYGVCTGCSPADGNSGYQGYPCGDQVGYIGIPLDSQGMRKHPFYFWGNTFNGDSECPIVIMGGYTDCYRSTQHIKEGVDYFNDETVLEGYIPYPFPHPLTLTYYEGECALDLSVSHNTEQVTLSWDFVTGADHYIVFRNWQEIETTESLTYSEDKASIDTFYMVYASDAEGNTISAEGVLVVAEADTVAPSTPADLTGTAVSENTINLSWTASNDNVGVAGYRVYRKAMSETEYTLIASPAGTTYSDNDVSENITYEYAVSAVDAVGNESEKHFGIYIWCKEGVRTVWAASCGRDDVQAAIDEASDGDTVLIPAGEAEWTEKVQIGRQLTWGNNPTFENKALTIQGAGIDKTIIIEKDDAESILYYGERMKPFRITGFTFLGTKDGPGSVINLLGECYNYLIDNCKFHCYRRAVKARGEGVISNSTIIRTNHGQGLAVWGELNESSGGWEKPLTLGTEHAIFLENCLFDFDDDYDGALDAYNGARYVFRYNKVINTGVGHHGFDSSPHSTHSFEIYNNEFIGNIDKSLIVGINNIRGGTGVISNNQVFYSGIGNKGVVGVLNYYRSNPDFNHGFGPCDGHSSIDGNLEPIETYCGYPCYEQIGRTTGPEQYIQLLEPLYFWNNSVNGDTAKPGLYLANESTNIRFHIKENRDYYNDTMRPGYKPYTYPHPLTKQFPPLPKSDFVSPGIPGNFRAEVLEEGKTRLNWDKPSESGGSGLAGYYIWLDGKKVSSNSDPAYTQYTFLGLETGRRYSVKVSAFDNAGNESEPSIEISLPEDGNHAPVFEDTGNKVITVGSHLEFQLIAEDPDNDNLIYTALNLPGGADFDQETATFSWIPIQDDMGTHTVSFTVRDEEELTDTMDVEIQVVEPLPEVEDLQAVIEYNSVYLFWKNPEGQGSNWDRVIVKRIEGSIENPEYDDGLMVYEGEGNSYIDRNLNQGIYTYTVFTYKDYDTTRIYSKPCTTTAEIEDTGHELLRIYPDEEDSLLIGQNTERDLYTLWREESITIGRGPTGNEISLWIYSDIIGDGENQVPAGSKILSARLVLTIKDSSFNDPIPIEYIEDDGNNHNDLFKLIYEDSRSIEIYQITDPDELGMPHYTEESGIRTGLDHEYRDHRPGVNKPWLYDDVDNESNEDDENSNRAADIGSNIDRLFTEQEPLNIIGLNTAVFGNELLDSIQFDITEAVQSWVDEGEDGGENQGLYITTGQDWNSGENLVLSGVCTENEEKRPYIEVIYSPQGADVDITPPFEVQNLKVIPGTDNIKLEWEKPTDTASTDFAGVKIIRREGIIPFNSQDNAHVIFIEKGSNTDIRYSYTDSGLIAGKDYYYALYTYDDKHNYSDRVWVKATPCSPAVPVLSASSPEKGELSLSWEKIDGASAYRLYRDDSDQVVVKNIENIEQGSVISYTDYLLKGSYRYHVTAVNDTGESPFSNELNIEIADNDIADNPPEEPSALQANLNRLTAELNWTDNSSDECGFVIERKIDNGEESEWEVIVRTGFAVETYLDRNLEPDTQYYYRIKAVNSKGSSEYVTADSVRTSDILKAAKDISWRVISSSHIRVEWEEVNKGVSYRVELYEIKGEENPLDTQFISTDYCYFLALEVGKEYIVRVFSMRDNDEEMAESDIIRTSADAKGGLF